MVTNMKKLLLKSLIIALIFCVGIASASSIQWYDYQTGVSIAEKSGKPMMIFVSSSNDPFGFEAKTLSDPKVVEKANDFITIKIDAYENAEIAKTFGIRGTPSVIFTNKEGEIVQKISGFVDSNEFMRVISEAWDKKDIKGETIAEFKEYNLGKVSIKELQDFINQKKSENFKVKFIVEGTIRNVIGTSIIVDDETGRLSITGYKGGLGNINDGNKVTVEGYANPQIYAIKISLSDISPIEPISNSQQSDSPSVSGFELISAFASLFLVAILLIKNMKSQ